MNRNTVIKCFAESTDLMPVYATEGSSGADIFAAVKETAIIRPGERKLIPTGLRIEIPYGFEAQIRPRSGLAAKHGISLVNTPGTIDSDYRGEIKVIMINLGQKDFAINRGDRIAQMVIAPVARAEFRYDENLNETERGEGGFGSTGT